MNGMKILYSFLHSLPYLVICLLCLRINLAKPYRSRQFIIPVFAVLYSAALMLSMVEIENVLRDSIEQHQGIFSSISDTFEDSLLNRLVFVINAALALLFLIFKVILLPLCYRLWRADDVMENTSSIVYERKHGLMPEKFRHLVEKNESEDSDDKDGKTEKDDKADEEKAEDWWVLKPDFRQYKRLFYGFYFAFFIASAIVFFISCAYPEWGVFKAVFYPVFGVLVLGEIALFLDGPEDVEPLPVVEKKVEKQLNPNFEALRRELADLFGNRELADERMEATQLSEVSPSSLIALSSSEDMDEMIVGKHFETLYSIGHHLDMSYIRTSLLLMKGKSALFCNPFYRDLTDYIMLPMVRQFMKYQKCLVIVGRESAAEDVCNWLRSGLSEFSGTDSLWKVELLTPGPSDADVGVLKFSDIYHREIQKDNREFFQATGFVLIIEPSRILATGQMGLNLLVGQCERDGKDVIYCACDRNCDGLVDALSHTLRTNITNVTATPKSTADNIYIYWAADGEDCHHKILPDISRYLGMGTEINTLAIKHQIHPVTWISGDMFPAIDMKWVDGQYFMQLCNVAGIQAGQSEFDNVFGVEPNLWCTRPEPECCLVIEDEFRNLFEMTRVFSTRATGEGCFNVLCEHYFLRDYMADNIHTLIFDPKAIPTIVPDFARTERNIVMRLIMMMDASPVSERRIEHELRLAGITPRPGKDGVQRILSDLFAKHCGVENAALRPELRNELQSDNPLSKKMTAYWTLPVGSPIDIFAQKLKAAYFIAEDETGARHYIGSSLYGHVFQAYLPGQFLTSEGKYYQVQTMTPESGIVVRRAADHIHGREYYRQIRSIQIKNVIQDTAMGSHRVITQMGESGELLKIEVCRCYADYEVETRGYLKLDEPDNLRHARVVDVSDIPNRSYHNKNILRVKMPGIPTFARYTICLLLNEMFKTIYPQAYHYIVALTAINSDIHPGYMKYAMYDVHYEDDDCDDAEISRIENRSEENLAAEDDKAGYINAENTDNGDNKETHEDNVESVDSLNAESSKPEIDEAHAYIDFIEDSEIDLGLIVSVERNLERFLGIICEVLMWHKDKMAIPIRPEKTEPEMHEVISTPKAPSPEPEEKKGLFARIFAAIRRFFGHKEEAPQPVQPEEPVDNTESKKTIDEKRYEALRKRLQRERNRWYHENGFLHYGSKDIPECLDIDETIKYLTAHGYDQNPIHAVRISAKRNLGR